MMKKHIMIILSVLVMTACASKENDIQSQEKEISVELENAKNQGDESKEENVNSEEKERVNEGENFQSNIQNDWDINLPTNFPVTEGKFLTATTSLEQQDAITFHFYETNSKLAINDPTLKEVGEFIGQLVITKYESAQAASDEIDQTVFKDGKAVDLGHGITGYQDAGAGSLFTSWNEGRWAIITRSRTEKSEESLNTAKETVEFLETHMLPIPKEYGSLHIDSELSGSMAKWQKQQYVFEMTDFKEKTLEWLITFE